jgi:F0F1-type ATP synthase alpha subunit
MQRERDVTPLAVQVAEVWALKTGRLDDVAPEAIAGVETWLRQLIPSFASLEGRIRSARAVDDELARELARWIEQAKRSIGAERG